MKYLILLSLLFSSFGYTCSPILSKEDTSIKGQVAKSFKFNDFIGYVYVTDKLLENGNVKYRFKVLGVFKGESEDFETDWAPECCACHKNFEEGETYILHASKHNSGWSVWEFGPTKKIKYMSSKELKYIEKYASKYRGS